MKKILFAVLFMSIGGYTAQAAAPTYVVQTAPQSNELNPVVTVSTAMTSAVSISPTVITRIDSAFNSAATTAIGANYQRIEITIQNNDTTNKFCGYSASALTTANSFKIVVGATWTFALGKGVALYCLNETGTGTLIVGGVAWK